MKEKLLIAYATKCGSTREIAEFMTKTLHEMGFEADLGEMKTVKSVKDYSGLVLGAPMYMFRIIGDAQNFLKKHKKDIEKKPTAFFSLGPTQDKEEELEECMGKF